jgi:hypothetical protein
MTQVRPKRSVLVIGALGVLVAMSSCDTARPRITIQRSKADVSRFNGVILEGSHLNHEGVEYVEFSGLEGGVRGWKERHLSRDGLTGVTVVLRLAASDSLYTVEEARKVEGYVFLRGALGLGLVWRIVGGSARLRVDDGGTSSISAELLLEELVAGRLGEQRADEATGVDLLKVTEIRLAENPAMQERIMSLRNTLAAPGLEGWREDF